MRRIERPDEAREEPLGREPPLPALRSIASAIENRSFTDLVVSARLHPELDPATPAWAEDGEIVLGPPAALLSDEERADVIQHEAIHVAQQRLAPAEVARGTAALKALKGPADAGAATQAIRARESQASTIKDRLGAILNPEKLSPAAVACPDRKAR